MGEIEHAGTSKTMPAITDDAVAGGEPAAAGVAVPRTQTNEGAGMAVPRTQTNEGAGVAVPRTRTSEEAGEVAGEIATEPTLKTYGASGADKVAAERGIRPITRPPLP
jgi:hypothetical protein